MGNLRHLGDQSISTFYRLVHVFVLERSDTYYAISSVYVLFSFSRVVYGLENLCQVLGDVNCLLTLTPSSTLWTFPRSTGSSRPHWRARPRGRRCPSRGRPECPARPRTDRLFEPVKESRKVEECINKRAMVL